MGRGSHLFCKRISYWQFCSFLVGRFAKADMLIYSYREQSVNKKLAQFGAKIRCVNETCLLYLLAMPGITANCSIRSNCISPRHHKAMIKHDKGLWRVSRKGKMRGWKAIKPGSVSVGKWQCSVNWIHTHLERCVAFSTLWKFIPEADCTKQHINIIFPFRLQPIAKRWGFEISSRFY